MPNLFSVPIFFILFRETLEASVVVSVLLGLVEQIVKDPDARHASAASRTLVDSVSASNDEKLGHEPEIDPATRQRRLLRKLRIQVFAGAALGLFIALCIGAAFLAVYYTQLKDLWAQSEELWEGIFSLIACIIIFIMSLAMLRMDKAKAKWRVKLAAAFHERPTSDDGGHHGGRGSRYALFFLPFITVLREGLEACLFVGGLALAETATAIPIAAIVGLICGLLVGLVIYFSASRINVSYFLVFSTSFLLLIGAGLAAKSVQFLQVHAYNNLVGGDISETGDGPGSFETHGNVWHLDCCNPENASNGGWLIFAGLLGWNNTASVGTILAYCFYWIFVIAALIVMKWKEGRVSFFGRESALARRRRARREELAVEAKEVSPSPKGSPDVLSASSGDDAKELS